MPLFGCTEVCSYFVLVFAQEKAVPDFFPLLERGALSPPEVSCAEKGISKKERVCRVTCLGYFLRGGRTKDHTKNAKTCDTRTKML